MNLEQIRIQELETALEANRTLLALESQRVRRIYCQLVCLGQEIGGEQFDQWFKTSKEGDISFDDLALKIVAIVRESWVSKDSMGGKDKGPIPN